MTIFFKIYNIMMKVIKYVATALFILLIAICFINVLSRYLLNNSLTWIDEGARFLLIWITFLGAVLANSSNKLMSLDVISDLLPYFLRKVLLIIVNLIVISITCILFIGSLQVISLNIDWKSSAIGIPYALVYSVIPFSCIFMSIQTAARIIKIIIANDIQAVEKAKEAEI